MTRRPFPFALALVTCVALAGCDRCSKPKDESGKGLPSAVLSPLPGTVSTATGSGNTTAVAAPTPVPHVQITDVTVGDGATAENGKKLSVHFVGTLENGTKFDSSKDKGQPFVFTLGTGMMIAGWDEGLKGMRVGGVRKLVIPPALAYGSRPVGSLIPPNSTLLFEIELLKVE